MLSRELWWGLPERNERNSKRHYSSFFLSFRDNFEAFKASSVLHQKSPAISKLMHMTWLGIFTRRLESGLFSYFGLSSYTWPPLMLQIPHQTCLGIQVHPN